MIPRSRQPNEFDDGPGQADPWLIQNGRHAPTDFLAEEAEFARNLNGLFQLEREELPPHFFQTINGTRPYTLARQELEQSVAVRVFQRLDLPPPAQPAPRQRLPHGQPLPRWSRALRASAVFALLLLSLVVAVPSIALGVSAWLSQPGLQVPPGSTSIKTVNVGATQYLSLKQVQQVLPFDVYWLGMAPTGYRFQSLRLRLDQDWTAGPLVESQYGAVGPETGNRLIIREFQPAQGSTVLLLADQRAVHQVQLADLPAIAIDGRWVRRYAQTVWEFGTQTELVFQVGGLIFWLTLEQSGGVTFATLGTLAHSLEKLSLDLPRAHQPELQVIPKVQLALPLVRPALGSVARLIPAGTPPESGAVVYIALGQPPDNSS